MFPVRFWILAVATERTCWHCAAEGAVSWLCSSGSTNTSTLLLRMVRVSGTTWMTFGLPARIREAVTATAGR